MYFLCQCPKGPKPLCLDLTRKKLETQYMIFEEPEFQQQAVSRCSEFQQQAVSRCSGQGITFCTGNEG